MNTRSPVTTSIIRRASTPLTDRPTIMAADRWVSNAALIADVASLGYIKPTDNVLDPTYGRGGWWKQYSPPRLTTHDLAVDGIDFRSLPEEGDSFDVVAYDPPYVSVGGRKTTSILDFHQRYGLTDTPSSPALLQVLVNDGLREAHRVVRGGGYVLVKCQDYVSSGQLWLGTHWTLSHAMSLGFTCVDRFEHVGRPRPQPPHARQVHARRNLSTLFVLRKQSK